MYPINRSAIKRILITRTDRIGDLVLSTPIFPAIKKRYPESHVAVLVFQETEPIVQGNPWIDQVIPYDKQGRHRSWWQTLLFGLKLRKENFDVAIHLHATNRVNIISWLAGIPVRIGYHIQLGSHGRLDSFLTHTIDEKKWQGKKHEAEYNFDLLALIDVPKPEPLQLHFPLEVSSRETLKRILPERFNQRYVVFHPSASCVSKRWSPERLASVADKLARDYEVLPVIIGEKEGVFHAAQMQEFMNEDALNLAGKLSLGMLGWLLKGARLLISNDSGPVHIAAAVGTPVVSIFGRNQPGLSAIRWRPLSQNSSYLQKDVGCVECLAHNCQIDFKCLKELTVNDVLHEARKYEPFLV
ncbi:MAG: lipopolysaccharide heptosyltransferase II [Omnitrophica bacterium RIFCSPHIGHO2_02_FULL_46_11]|nr:MAG: lipopolysaccharide heptosyltransferase II [Omnitrophica bacterium RIFCSPHIGHO2_02_FULL_46_11]OGW87642.1 MAG: lipopolysaccharide heptosyltransferase II [Omnitrophica bacterium RIFCSPLOWO2_01_FULL_45_10b]